MQAGLQMAGPFCLCIGRSPFSEREPQRGGIELKARQIGRRENPVRDAEKTVMQASLQMTVFFDLCIGRSPSARGSATRGVELKHVRSDGEKTPVRQAEKTVMQASLHDCLFRFVHRAEPFQ